MRRGAHSPKCRVRAYTLRGFTTHAVPVTGDPICTQAFCDAFIVVQLRVGVISFGLRVRGWLWGRGGWRGLRVLNVFATAPAVFRVIVSTEAPSRKSKSARLSCRKGVGIYSVMPEIVRATAVALTVSPPHAHHAAIAAHSCTCHRSNRHESTLTHSICWRCGGVRAGNVGVASSFTSADDGQDLHRIVRCLLHRWQLRRRRPRG